MPDLPEIRRKPGVMTEVWLTRDGDQCLNAEDISVWPISDEPVFGAMYEVWDSYPGEVLRSWSPRDWKLSHYGPLPRKGSKRRVMLEL